jgi:membrane protein DedA with SNARE-associated domain
MTPFAQIVQPVFGVRAWSLGEFLIAVVVIAACVALVWVALTKFGITFPDWVVQVFWIVIVAFVVILAIHVVLSL